jgi:DNA-binding beta-propeller fold protein YncE
MTKWILASLACLLSWGSAALAACPYTAGAAAVQVPGRPFAAEPSADGCWMFAALVKGQGGSQGGIAVLKNVGGAFSLARTVPLRRDATGVALSHDGATLVAAVGDGVAVLDTARLESGEGDAVLGYIDESAENAPVYVAISNDDRLVFISDEHSARITVADLARGRREGFGKSVVIGEIPSGNAPVGLAVSPDGKRLYATAESMQRPLGFAEDCQAEKGDNGRQHPEGGLLTIDIATAAQDPAHAIIALTPAGCNPVRVALSHDGSMAWVTARGGGQVLAFDTRQMESAAPLHTNCVTDGPLTGAVCPNGIRNAPRSVFAVGSSPVGIAIRPDGQQVWVANSNRFATDGKGFLTMVRTADGGIGGTVPSGAFPRDLRFLPDGTTLVAAVFGSQAIQFVPTR